MDFTEDVIRPLHTMLMPARWHGLRRNELNRVMGQLIYPRLYRYPPNWYLNKINAILSLEEDLSLLLQDRHPSETDQEVRGFLSDLALEIERAFPTVARSGQRVSVSGDWVSDGCGDILVRLDEGDSLPYVERKAIVWEKKNDVASSPEQVIVQEFATYYTRRSIGGRLLYMQPEEYGVYSVGRLLNQKYGCFKSDIADLLLVMSKERLHPLTKQIEQITQQKWTEEDEVWEWYRSLLTFIHSGMKNGMA